MVSNKDFYQKIDFEYYHYSIINLSPFKELKVNTRLQAISIYREWG